MRKILALLAFAFMMVTANAQKDIIVDDSLMEENDSELVYDEGTEIGGLKHGVITNTFWSNWFVQGAAMFSSFWGDQEASSLPNGMEYSFRNNWGMSLAIGKWFTPGVGLRLKLNGFWGRTVVSGTRSDNFSNYYTLHAQALFNLSNMLYGYNEKRLYNCIPYAGMGFGKNTSYHSNGMGISMGLLNTFRIHKKISLNLDINYGMYEGKMDGQTAGGGKYDRILNFEVGATYSIGKSTWQKSPDLNGMRIMQITETEALNAQIRDLQLENEELRRAIDEK